MAASWRRQWMAGWAIASIVALASGCAAPIDITRALQVTDVTKGWFDAGIVEGKNKLVPSIAFRLKNVGDREISNVQLNVVFQLAPDWRDLDDAFLRGIGSDGLAPGATSDRFVVRAKYGFTGEQPRAEMLQHGKFADARVRIQGKHASNQWIQLGEFPVERRLLTN
jgi:hypothetical protein